MAMPEEPRATVWVNEPIWKTTLPVGTAVLPVAETFAVRVYVEPAVREPVGETDKAVVVGMAVMVSFSVFEVLAVNSVVP